jgi:IS5 family transposase
MGGIYAGKTSRPSYPLLTLLCASLLGIWDRLSDVELSHTLFHDLLFSKFCRLELGSDVPDATTIRRFCQQLVEHGLWDILLGEVNRQLEAKHIIMTEGHINIIDATPVEAAQSGHGKDANDESTRDPEAGWYLKADSRGNTNPSMGIRSTLASMRMVSYIVRPSRPETHMTAPNGTHFYWVMRRRYMRMRRITRKPHAIN